MASIMTPIFFKRIKHDKLPMGAGFLFKIFNVVQYDEWPSMFVYK
jgi:hypothetical protein